MSKFFFLIAMLFIVAKADENISTEDKIVSVVEMWNDTIPDSNEQGAS